MNKGHDMLDTSKLCFEGDFATQVSNLLMYVRLTRQEVEELTQLFDDLEEALQYGWPGCQVLPFGSIVTGMGIRTSDVDCYIHLPNNRIEQKKSIVMAARNILKNYPHIFQELFAIVTAKVPIVKFYHVPTNRHCDVSFKSADGVRNSNLLAYLLKLNINALNLAIIIKYWSKVHALTGTNLMPNYALTLLVIFYLQQEKVLPPIRQLQRNIRPEIINHWNMAFDDIKPYITYNKKPLYHLLGGFFKFYNNFKFPDNIISLYEGTVLNKRDFENVDRVSDIYHLYKENVRNDYCKMFRIDSYMCVQDPFDHSRNCTVAVYPKLAHRVINCFKSASNAYEEETCNNFLRAILKHNHSEELVVKPKKYKPLSHNVHNVIKRPNSNRGFKKNKFNQKAVKTKFTTVFEELKKKMKDKS